MAKSGVYDTNKTELSVAEESSINDALAPEARFECPICLAWLRDPVLTSCGHRFCRNCIYPWLDLVLLYWIVLDDVLRNEKYAPRCFIFLHNNGASYEKRKGQACPVDNMKLNKADIFPDNFTRREISQQRTKCPNIVRGCLKELSPLDIEAHLLVCEYKIPELPDNEKLRCSFVDVGCTEKFEDEPKLTKHLEEQIQKHLALLSKAYSSLSINKNEPSSSSSIAQQANFWDPPPKNSEPAALQDDNLQELLKTLYEKIVYLEQKSREQDIIIANMSQQIASQSLPMTKLNQLYCNGCFLWYVSDFKSKMTAMRENPHAMYYSTGFYTSPNGYKLCVRLNLSPKDNNYIAILIHVMRTDHDHTLDWPFTGKLSITLVHPTQSFRSIKETMITRPELGAFKRPVEEMNSKGFGYTEFALLEEIIEQDFISNNQLLIKVQAQTV